MTAARPQQDLDGVPPEERLAALFADPGFHAGMTEIDEAEASLVELMREFCDLPVETRHSALSDWARSEYWHPALMLCTDWQGRIAREAYNALKIDLAADTPGRRWSNLDIAIGRASIIRLLGLEGVPAAFYASTAFRSWRDDDDRTWIAGAVGAEPLLDTPASLRWRHLDIQEVILWDPRTNETRIAGEHQSTNTFVMPDQPDDRLLVWGDAGAFFRAWAARRARAGRLAQLRAAGEWVHPISEPADGNLPGALLVGNYLRAAWPGTSASTVIAADGITPAELHFAAVRAARLPQFEGV